MSYRLNQCHGLRVSISAGLRPSNVTKGVFIGWARLSSGGPAWRSIITLDRYPLTEAIERSRIGVVANGDHAASTLHINNSTQATQFPNNDRFMWQDLDQWILLVGVVDFPASSDQARSWYVRDVSGVMTGTQSAAGSGLPAAVAGPMEFIDVGSRVTLAENNANITHASTDGWRFGPCAILLGADKPTEAEVESIRGGRGFNSVASTGTPLAVYTGTDLVDKINGLTLAPFGGAAIANFDTTNEPTCFVWEPTAQTVAEGAAATFEVWATAPGGATYQWQRQPAGGGGFADIAGATSRTYAGAATALANNGDQFRCRLNPAGANIISRAVTLTVSAPASTLSGNATLAPIVASGSFISGASTLTGNATLGPITASGFLGSAPVAVIVPELRNWGGSLQAGVTIPVVTVCRLDTGAQVLTLTNQTTNGSGNLSITNAALVPGTAYMVIGWNADGSQRFAVPIVAG